MRKLFLLFIFLPMILFSQTNSGQDFIVIEANVGANYSLLNYEGAEFERRINPFIGANFRSELSEKFGIKFSALYSIRGSQSISPHFWHRNNYVELKVLPQLLLTDFVSLNIGLAASLLMKSRELVLDGNSASGKNSSPIEGYDSEYHPVISIDFHLDEKFIMGLSYFVRLNKVSSQNLQIGLQIPLRLD